MFRLEQNKIIANEFLNHDMQFKETVFIQHDLAYPFTLLVNPTQNDIATVKEELYVLGYCDETWTLRYKKNIDAAAEKIEISNVKQLAEKLKNISHFSVPTNIEKQELKVLLVTYRIENELPQTKHHENIGSHVTTASSMIGKFLFSKNFNPCQAVIAKLNDGQFALYHAFTNTETDSFLHFIALIQNKIDYIFLLQKEASQENLGKAPVMALNLSKHLNREVPCINLKNYQAIVLDAVNNKIVVCMNIKFFNEEIKEAKNNLADIQVIDMNDIINLENNIKRILIEYNYKIKINKSSIEAGPITIPIKFMTAEMMKDCQDKLNFKLYQAAEKNNEKKIKNKIKDGANIQSAMMIAQSNNNTQALNLLAILENQLLSSSSIVQNSFTTFSTNLHHSAAAQEKTYPLPNPSHHT